MSSSVPTVVFDGVTKTFGEVTAIEDLRFEARPGRVLGLLGRNGAGKTTALRVLLGLAAPTEGTATVLGAPFADLPDGQRRVGVAMEGLGHLPGASGVRELRVWASMLGVSDARVADVARLVDLPVNDRRRVAAYSTGMRQRLALAIALLPDPEVLILDEPANGLDPVGVRWLRDLLRRRAAEGGTVVVSSHLLAEVEQTVDDVVVLDRTVRYAGTLDDLTGGGAHRLEDRFFDLVGQERSEAADA